MTARDRLLAACVTGWALAALLPNVLAFPQWPWVAAQARTPVDQATQFLAGGHAGTVIAGTLLLVAVLGIVGRASRFVLVTLPVVALVPLESLYILHYGQPTNAAAFAVAGGTSWREAREFVSGIVLGGVVASVAFLVAGLALFRVLRARDLAWRHPSRWWSLVAVAIVGIALIAHDGGLDAISLRPAGAAETGAKEVLSPLERSIERAYPLGLVARWNEYAYRRRAIGEAAARAAAFRFHSRAGPGADVVVLVIGESIRADHLGLNGYARETTPALARLKSLYSFRRATSAAAATREAVPYMLTRRTPGPSEGTPPAEPSIVAAFREAGFSTSWISTQAPLGALEDLTSAFAEEAANRRFLNAGGYGKRAALDDAATSVLADALSDGASRHFVVVHLLQAHWDYRLRYPDHFAHFRPAGIDGEIWSIYSRSRREAIVNAYDNAVRYADHVLARLIDVVQSTSRPAAVVYMADHGQTLFDGRCLTSGHGVPSRTVFEVPLLVWLSPQFVDRFADKAQAVSANTDRPVTAESVFPTLADLGGLEFDGAKQRLSVANRGYVPGSRLATVDARKWIDLDRDLPALDCAGAR